jgi:hypothetical protein
MVSAWLPLPRSTTLGSTPPRSYRKRKPGPGSARSQPISPKTPPIMAAGRVSRASQVFCLSSTFFFFFVIHVCLINIKEKNIKNYETVYYPQDETERDRLWETCRGQTLKKNTLEKTNTTGPCCGKEGKGKSLESH